jgi:hypothetical protein
MEYDNNGDIIIHKVEDWELKVLDLIDKFISHSNYSSPAEKERIDDLIIDIYHQAIEEWNEVPDFEVIDAMVSQYNWEIIMEMAAIEFANDYYNQYYQRSKEQIHECIADIAGSWMDSWYYQYFSDLEFLIKDILKEKAYAYEVSDEDELREFFSTDVSIVQNDCQNLILPEWKEVGQKYMEKHCSDVSDITVMPR